MKFRTLIWTRTSWISLLLRFSVSAADFGFSLNLILAFLFFPLRFSFSRPFIGLD